MRRRGRSGRDGRGPTPWRQSSHALSARLCILLRLSSSLSFCCAWPTGPAFDAAFSLSLSLSAYLLAVRAGGGGLLLRRRRRAADGNTGAPLLPDRGWAVLIAPGRRHFALSLSSRSGLYKEGNIHRRSGVWSAAPRTGLKTRLISVSVEEPKILPKWVGVKPPFRCTKR